MSNAKTFPVVGSPRKDPIETTPRFPGLASPNRSWKTVSEKEAEKTARKSEPVAFNTAVTKEVAETLPFDVEVTAQPLHRVAKPVKPTAKAKSFPVKREAAPAKVA